MGTYQARLAWRSYSDHGNITATSQAGNMLAANLQNTNIQTPWASTTTTAQILSGQFDGIKSCSYLCLYAHNFSYAAAVRLQLSLNSDMSSPTYDHTWDAVLPAYGFGTDPFGLVPFGGYETGLETPYSVFWFDAVLANYWRITITDTPNPNGYIKVGRLMLGDYWQPEDIHTNITYPYSRKDDTTSTVQTSRSGAIFVDKGVQYRRFTFNYSHLSSVDEDNLHAMFRECDLGGNVLFSAYPETGTTEESAHTALCVISSTTESKRGNFVWREQGFVLQEVV